MNGEITIHNNPEEVIEDWKLLLDCTTDINVLWTADIAHKAIIIRGCCKIYHQDIDYIDKW